MSLSVRLNWQYGQSANGLMNQLAPGISHCYWSDLLHIGKIPGKFLTIIMTSYNYNIRLEQDLSTFFFFQQKQVLVFKMHHVINHHSHISINLSVNSMSKLYSIVVHQQLKFIIRRMFHQHFYIYPKKNVSSALENSQQTFLQFLHDSMQTCLTNHVAELLFIALQERSFLGG